MAQRTAAVLACLAALAGSSAAEGRSRINDVRFTLGAGVDEDAEIRGGGRANVDADRWFASVQGVRSIAAMASWGAVIYGGEAFLSSSTAAAKGGTEFDVVTTGLSALLGYAYQFPSLPSVHAESALFGSFGSARSELYSGTSGIDASDPFFAYGLRAGAYWTSEDAYQLGLDLRYTLDSETSPSFSTVNAGTSVLTRVQYSYEGLGAALSFGYRF